MSKYDYVSCNSLWIETLKNDPNRSQVIEAQERIKNYTKQDWLDMADEARNVVNNLGQLVIDDIDYKSEEAKEAFDHLVKHVSTWFFNADKAYCDSFSNAIMYDIKYVVFFDQFQDGLSSYMIRLLTYWGDSI